MDDAQENKKDQDQPTSPEPEVTFSFDSNVGDAIQGGMDALKMVMEGVVSAAQEMVGPEGMRNLEASQWLAQVATTVEEIATGLEQKAPLAGKAGEIACFLEQVESEVKGSKFQAQLPSFRQRLEEVTQLLDRPGGEGSSPPTADELKQLNDSAGYFRAAASTAVPISPESSS